MTRPEQRAGGRRTPSPAARVWVLLLAVAAVAALLHQRLLDGAVVVGDGPQLGLPVMVALFTAAVSVVVHLRTGRDGASFSPVEVPLVLGLFLATPTSTILGCVLGTAVVLGLVRPQPPLKLAFNLAQNALSCTTAVCAWRAVVGDGPVHSLRATLAAVGAAVVMSVVAATCISLAMAARDRTLPSWPVALGPEALVSCANASFGLVALDVLRTDPRGAWTVAGLAAFLWAAQRAHLSLARKHDDLERLQAFVARLGGDLALDAAAGEVLRAAREVTEADQASLVLSAGPDGDAPAWTCDRAGVRPGRPDDASTRGRPSLSVDLRDETGLHGVLTLLDRPSDNRHLRAGDRRLLEALAGHAVIALHNGRLVDRLRTQVVETAHQAVHDTLTGLPNRTLFDRVAQEAVASGRPCALLLFDLDRFKEVNDTLGHAAGDEVLRAVGERLRTELTGAACVARLGGDEFGVVLPDADLEAAWQVAEQVRRVVARPLEVKGVRLTVDASTGIALADDSGYDVVELLRHADVAMYAAKDGQVGVALYDASRDHHTAERLTMVADLRAGIAEGQLRVVYQPKVSTTGRTVTGVEALVRWEHPERGTVPPDAFIDVAERTGLIGPLTDVVLREALRQCRRWREQGLDLGVAVNLSPRSLQDTAFPEQLQRVLHRAGVPPERLTLEITEGALMVDPERAIAVLHELRALGVHLSVDDLGVGHSSLAYLTRLPVHEVKVDRSFVTALADDADDRAVVEALVGLVHRLGRTVVAEGVEDQRTYDLLAALGADSAQGYWMSRPLPPAEVPDWVRAWCDGTPGPATPPAVPRPRSSAADATQPVTGTA